MVIVMYYEVVNIQDLNIVDSFKELAKTDSDAALAYLAQWDYGESNPDEVFTRHQLFARLRFADYIENAQYLALWQIGIDAVSLYRKVMPS